MTGLPRAVGYGVVVWLVPFLTAVVIFPIHDANRPLFESIMPVTVAAITSFLGIRYLRQTDRRALRDGLVLGLLWLAISVLIDVPLMLFGGPMRMTVGEYVSDIGLTYVLIPVVTTGLAAARTPAAGVR